MAQRPENDATGPGRNESRGTLSAAAGATTRRIALFSKYWQGGRVKTRLAADIGASAAASLHRLFLECLLVRLASCGDVRTCAGSPADRLEAFERLAERIHVREKWNFVAQTAGDLGRRMEQFFDSAHTQTNRVVIVGTDSPNLPLAEVDRAFELLERVTVALGPASDGGYWLLGIHGPLPPIFDGIGWGGDGVLRQTTDRLEQAGLSYGFLSPWYDVDTVRDLAHLVRDLRSDSMPVREPALDRLRMQIESRVPLADLGGRR